MIGGSSPTSWPPGALDPGRVTPDRIVALHPDGSVAETKPAPGEPDEPDRNCITTPDGGCVGGPCMHDPHELAPEPEPEPEAPRTRAEIYNERKAAAAAARGGAR